MDAPRFLLKPSEVRNAFATAKARAARAPLAPRILSFFGSQDHNTTVITSVPIQIPLFDPMPAEVWIDDYTPFTMTKIKLTFRNRDRVPRRLKIEQPSSPLFKVKQCSSLSSKGSIDGKIAAGMEVEFFLEFSPQEVKHMVFDLICCTERERFAVPVHVRGHFAILDVPDEIDLGICPVKMTTTKVLVVRNIGSRSGNFSFRASEFFKVHPEHFTLAPGDSLQMEIEAMPPRLTVSHGEVRFVDDTGQTVLVSLTVRVKNLDVYVNVPVVEPSATYVSLTSRQVIKICNDSDYPVDFVWKAFPDPQREEQERVRILDELREMELVELEQCAQHEEPTGPFNGRGSVQLKYKHLRKAATEDTMHFVDETFSVSPLKGRVWAQSDMDVTVSFSPTTAMFYSCNAFLEIGGQEARLPLQIRAEGIGPKAKVVYNELLDFGEVHISDERTRDFTIQNKGEIPAKYTLMPLVPPIAGGMNLKVMPESGTLAVNEMCKIEVSFTSSTLGELFQPICFRLTGSDEQLVVRAKATVVPPVFHFDVDQIDFGAVSYSFPQSRTVKLVNTSKIAVDYALRIPEEDHAKKKEFELLPSSGRLEAYGEQTIQINFVPMNTKLYDYRILVQVPGISSYLSRLSLRAHSLVPEVSFLCPELDFGPCFLRYPHKQTLVLQNKSSHLSARYSIGEPDEHSRAIASYSTTDYTGSISPGAVVNVDIHLSCEKLGPIRLPMTVSIPGSTDLPLMVTLTACGIGPQVELDQTEVNWGSCSCLVEHERVLRVTNASLIPAVYKTFIRNARSKFTVDRKEGTILPGCAVDFTLSANLDDTIVFKDSLHILIAEGDSLVVPLIVKGTGTTMWTSSELRVIDFGHQMTHRECEWSCTLENKGKRSQLLTWTNRSAMRAKQQITDASMISTKATYTSKGRNARKTQNEGVSGDIALQVFTVFPATIELKPRTACVFVFKGISSVPGVITEELVCETRVGKEKNTKVAFIAEARAEFVSPRLEPSCALLSFIYIHNPQNPLIPHQSQHLTLTNSCALPLSFTLRAQPPFSLNCWEADLQPGATIDVVVDFFPGFKDDFFSRVVQGRLAIIFVDHPQKDGIDLLGDICFPNLQFEMTKIDFGCTLNDTQRSMLVSVTNVSKVDASFRWVFIEDEKEGRALATLKKPYFPANQVFDILPIRGLLKPGETEKIEFSFYGHANRKFRTTVACEVAGGPEYELIVQGEASSLLYKLDRRSLDFGQVLYNKTEDREFAIINAGKVPFSFSISMGSISRGRVVIVSPTSGKVMPNDKQRVLVQLRPGIPEAFEETIFIEIAHFQPVVFKLLGSGVFAAVSITLPRENHPSCSIHGEHPNWKNLTKVAKANLQDAAASVLSLENERESPEVVLRNSESHESISSSVANRLVECGNSFSSNPHGTKAVTSNNTSMNGAQSSTATLRSTSSGTAPYRVIDDLDVEIEVLRMFFAEYLIRLDQRKVQQDTDRAEQPEQVSYQGNGGNNVADVESGDETKSRKRTRKSSTTAPEALTFILSQFVLDFGNVVLGTHKIKKFTVINIGHTPASFQIDKNLAQSRGFQIDPERVVRLPEKEPIEFTVTFQARKNVSLGLHQVQLPIVMKNGPPCIITIKAFVTVPDVSISSEALDFGRIQVGSSFLIQTQLQNTSNVVAEWAIKKPLGSARDAPYFRIAPQAGSLAPGNRVNIQVEFLPDEGRLYSLKVPVKVAANMKTRSLTFRGEGADLRLCFIPPIVELGPLLPGVESTEQEVELLNDSDYPVEVYSLDFDKVYQRDETLLRDVMRYDADGVLRLPPWKPGQPLREYLCEHKVIEPACDLSACGNELAGSVETVKDAYVDDIDKSPDEETNVVSARVSDEAVAHHQSERGIDYIIVGPPRCGKTTQARMLAEREKLCLWTIDDAIEHIALDLQSELGRATRSALGCSVSTHSPDSVSHVPLVDDPPSDVPHTSPPSISASTTLDDLIVHILRRRLSENDMLGGSVLDGWYSRFVSCETSIRACAEVMQAARIVWLQIEEDEYEALNLAIRRAEADAGAHFATTSSFPSVQNSLATNENLDAIEGTHQFDSQTYMPDEDPAHSSINDQAVGVDGGDIVRGEMSDCGNQESDTIQRIRLEFHNMYSHQLRDPPSYSEYRQQTTALRKMVHSFLARDHLELARMHLDETVFAATTNDSSVGSSTQSHHEDWTELSESALKVLARPDNFLLEFSINQILAPLVIHNGLVSTLEKYIRELELCHLQIPSPVKYQLVKRPAERFSRKRIQRFTLLQPGNMLHESTSPDQSKSDDHEADAMELVNETTRWVLPPHGSTRIRIRFASKDVGTFDAALGFEIVGIRREFNLFCHGTASVPQINADPRNVFMSRIKSRLESVYVSKKFVMSTNTFEFGPLIVPSPPVLAPSTDDEFSDLCKLSPGGKNFDTFRISNVSKGALTVDFVLVEDHDLSAFAVSPRYLELSEHETKEVKVWAYPRKEGLHESSLVCCIADNPEPVLFAISCFGCRPSLVLRGPWDNLSDKPQTPDIPEGSTAGLSPPWSVPPNAQVSTTTETPVLDFEQMLLKRHDEKTFHLENTCPLVVTWKLSCLDDIPPDFHVFPTEGILKPFQKIPIVVAFTANTEAQHKHILRIEYSDQESGFRATDSLNSLKLILLAEAYKIDVCSFQNEGGTLGNSACDGAIDFGLVRVGERSTRSFSIKNRGKYNVKIMVTLRNSTAREMFRVDPVELILEPDRSASVDVAFEANREVILKDSRDIKCTIIEMLTGEPCAEFHVLTSIRAVFSVFRVQPTRGINFGPLKFNDKPRSKKIEIRNDGDFAFKFRVVRGSSETSPLTFDTQIVPNTLNLGQFQVIPDAGIVDPGTITCIDVTFEPRGCELYRELVRIEVSGRNQKCGEMKADPLLNYELVGESCYPLINTDDFDSIFEEQIVVRTSRMDVLPGSHVPEDKYFALPSVSLAAMFAEKERIFFFGAHIAATNARGSMERFKITNPTKVMTTVIFDVSPTIDSTQQLAAPSNAFSVQPSMWEIPPLEHRFVNVYFKPSAIFSYSGIFTARVDEAGDGSNPILQFELRGEGTLPCITVLEPTAREGNGLIMPFGRVRVSKSRSLKLVLRNDGILPATVLFSMQSNPNFLFPSGNGSTVVTPQTTETMTIHFRPQKAHDDALQVLLRLTVQNNPYDETSIQLSGQGYYEDLAFEDLSNDTDDEIHFEDTVVVDKHRNISADKVFTMCNQSNDILRFSWPIDDSFSFTPRVGHIRPRGSKLVKATFSPRVDGGGLPVVFTGHKVFVETQRIVVVDEIPNRMIEWDDTKRVVEFDESNVIPSDVGLGEPKYEALGSPCLTPLSCFAVVDTLAYTCDTTSIAFRPTFMLQVSSHKITIRNTCKARLQYCWKWRISTAKDPFPGGHLGAGIHDTEDECPFEVSPSSGTISAENAQVFIVKFSPVEVDDFHYDLCLFTPNGNFSPDVSARSDHTRLLSQSLQIQVTGESLRPVCHFDIERSEYLARRVLSSLGSNGRVGSLDDSVRVIEMESLGVRVKNTKRFYVVNPTNVSYEFSWAPEGEMNASFRCVTPKGIMLAGKRCEMVFEFIPQQLELQEALWHFRVPHFQLEQLFLLVGTTTEPRVMLDRGSVNFNTLLVGTKASQSISIVNHEHIPFNFVFDKTTIDFAGEIPSLVVQPLAGVVPPNGRCSIEIEFSPTDEKPYSFNLNCLVKRKPTRLSLNVKGEGYSIHDALVVGESGDDSRQAIVGPGNRIDFGSVRLHESSVRCVTIYNSGKFNFEFGWSHETTAKSNPSTTMSLPASLSIEPLHGTVKKNDKVVCTFTFAPTKPMSLDTFGQLVCSVAGTRQYCFSLHGSAVPPSVQFSFTSFDFGPCFVAEGDAPPPSQQIMLVIRNLDVDSSVDLDCLFEKKAHLRVQFEPTVLGPCDSVNVPIIFSPRQEITYLDLVPFVVNGTSTISVTIRGQGVTPKIELANSSMQMVAFGSLQVGQHVTKVVKVINRGQRQTRLEFADSLATGGESQGVHSLSAIGITIAPQEGLTLRPKESADIQLSFSPTQRKGEFQRDLYIIVAASTKKLLSITGCCQGMDVQLDSDTISFGTVCLGSQLVRKVHLHNRGDIPAKFQWNASSLAPDYSISPLDGVVPSNSFKLLEVTFRPSRVSPELRRENLCCVIEGTDPVFLTLVGACVTLSAASINDVFFECRVREEITKVVTIENRTASPWNLLPVVHGDHWSCQDNVAVPAEGKAMLMITYRPLSMTKKIEGESPGAMIEGRVDWHEGRVFLAIPDGSALLYNVFGKAEAPLPIGPITISAPAKKSTPISLPLSNWLKKPQTFNADIQKHVPDPDSVLVQGAPSVIIAGEATRNYHLKVFAYKEGQVQLRVRFVNPESEEYVEFDVQVTITKPAEIDTICMEAPVRQRVRRIITVENPFPSGRIIHYVDNDRWWKCSSPNVRVNQIRDINTRPEGTYEIEYRPVLHVEHPVEAFLTISFVELGDFVYRLVLSTQSAGTDQILHFKTSLGSFQTQVITFSSFADRGADLTCCVQQHPASFVVPASVHVEPTSDWEGKLHVMHVKFEPEALGEIHDTLVLKSESLGEYRYALQGHAIPPLPQGPILVTGTKDIEFKNVFSTECDFEFVVDNPRFTLNVKVASIPAKSTRTVTVNCDTIPPTINATSGVTTTSKLLVTCLSMRSLPPWVYYLESN